MMSRRLAEWLLQATKFGVLGVSISICVSQQALGETALLGVDRSGAFLIETQSAVLLTSLESPSLRVSTQGIRGSGVRGDDEAEALGIRGSGVRGIRGSGVRGIRGSGVRGNDQATTLGIRGSGLRESVDEAQQSGNSMGLPLLAVGPVTEANGESISVLGAKMLLEEDTHVVAVDSSGQISTNLATDRRLAVQVGDYIAVGGFGTGDTRVSVIVISPDQYLDGSSTVYLRGKIADINSNSAKLDLNGANVDYSGALWGLQSDDIGEGASAEFSGVAHAGVLYATGGELLETDWIVNQPSTAKSSSQGIRGSGVRGIRGSGVRGIRGSGVRGDDEAEALGIRGSGVRGIRGSGVRGDDEAEALGIRGSGVRGIRGSGVRGDDEAEALGIRGSGVRGIRGSGVRGDDEAEALGIRGSGVRGIRGSGVRGDDEAEALGIRGSGLR